MARLVRHLHKQNRLSRGLAATWTEQNPVLFEGEMGWETDTERVKVGDGSSPWVNLAYAFESGGGVTDHGDLTGLGDDDHTAYATNVELTAHIDDTSDAHDASAVSVDSTTLVGVGTDVQAVLEELDDAIAALRTVDYLVGTATSELSGEIVAGTTPGGELGGTWASPTVDATHAGSTHSAATDTHIADTTDAHDASAISVDSTTLVGVGTDVQAVFEELDDAIAALRAVDFLVGTATGELSGEIAVGTTPGGELGGTWASPTVDATHSGSAHTDFIAKSLADAKGDIFVATADNTVARLAVGANGKVLTAASGTTEGVEWADPTGGGATIDIEEDNAAVGAATTIDFGTGLDVAFASGEADVTVDLSEVSAFTDHSARHEDGGADEISLTGLSGDSAAVTALRAVDFLVGTATGELSGEIAVGTTPGGELGGTWASPTVDATHSGSTHSAATDTHIADTTDVHDHGHLAGLTDDDHTQYLKETDVAAKGDLYAASADNTVGVLTVGANGRHLVADSGESLGVKWDTETITIGALINGGGSAISTGTHPVWRVPYSCTVTAVRGYVDTGTTTVINAGEITDGDFCSSDITIDPADAWEAGTVNQNTALVAGDTVYVQVVTAGTATELTIQVDITRP